MRTVLRRCVGPAIVSALLMAAAACGGSSGSSSSGHLASIVVTSNVLGDVVRNLVGEAAAVDVLMPPNTDPHEFSASAQQAVAMRSADVLVVNGLGFESGLADAIGAARSDGVAVIEVAPLAPRLRTLTEAGSHGPAATDPHVFTDPARMAVAVAGLAQRLEQRVRGLDTAAVRGRADAYVARLRTLDTDMAQVLAAVPASRRILVTNHDALGYLADRYGYTILGTVIPSLSTLAEPSASGLTDLAAAIDRAGVPAIFADTSSPRRLADALAAEGHHVQVVQLYVESLGSAGSGAATYEEMMRTDAARIAAALR